MNKARQLDMIQDPQRLLNLIEGRLNGNGIVADWPGLQYENGSKGSAVLFLLTSCPWRAGGESEVCVLLNKRSRKVAQPGDLCCPGGRVESSDKPLSRLMYLPFFPLHRWARSSRGRNENRKSFRRLALVLAAGLREAWEEMRLNPLKVKFLGPLPVQQLLMYNRKIHPVVAWVPGNMALKPNREVERLVYVPLRLLLDTSNYGRYHLTFQDQDEALRREGDMPCFVHHGRQGTEILWGATLRITLSFLNLVFAFALPALESLPLVKGQRDKSYLGGSLWEEQWPSWIEGEQDF